MTAEQPAVSVKPLIPERWRDFEHLFGPRGACAGCWCMYWKLPGKEFDALVYDGTKAAQRAIVKAGVIPGLLAYDAEQPVGWMAIEPRSQYPRLNRSRILKPVDGQPVWSITCFFTRRDHRGQGIALALLRASVGYVRQQGGRIIEGYPKQPRAGRAPDASVFTGLVSAFRDAGFAEVERRSETRRIFRFVIGD